jgi:D-alanine-D-alanine ligase
MNKPLIFHSKIESDPPPDELDVLDEVIFFEAGLRTLGYEVHKFDFENDLDRNAEIIKEIQPDFIVNLVETINGDGRLIHIAPAFFEHLSVRFTGCPSEAIYVSSNKLLSKKIMQLAGIPTPVFAHDPDHLKSRFSGRQFLLKSLWEHASFGMDEHNPVFLGTAEEIAGQLAIKNKHHQKFFAEEYIEGREFNVSMIAGKKAPIILPVAEIKFLNYPDVKPKIVGYRAKWDEASFEYKNTIRQFVDELQEPELCEQIRQICLKCWKKFDLKGYARIDFRMDSNNRLYVLEINANPCISADSGFVAASARKGFSQADIIKAIIKDAINIR